MPVFRAIGVIGFALLALAAPAGGQQPWQGFRDAVTPQPAPAPMPNIIRPGPPAAAPSPPTTSPHGAARPMPSGRLDGRVTHVRDGDTIVVDRTPIRFENIDCAEKGTRRGDRASEAMRRLAAGQPVRCQLAGRRSHDREIGTCALLDGRDLGTAMVTQGLCVPRR